jgi:hypothetical protein
MTSDQLKELQTVGLHAHEKGEFVEIYDDASKVTYGYTQDQIEELLQVYRTERAKHPDDRSMSDPYSLWCANTSPAYFS